MGVHCLRPRQAGHDVWEVHWSSLCEYSCYPRYNFRMRVKLLQVRASTVNLSSLRTCNRTLILVPGYFAVMCLRNCLMTTLWIVAEPIFSHFQGFSHRVYPSEYPRPWIPPLFARSQKPEAKTIPKGRMFNYLPPDLRSGPSEWCGYSILMVAFGAVYSVIN